MENTFLLCVLLLQGYHVYSSEYDQYHLLSDSHSKKSTHEPKLECTMKLLEESAMYFRGIIDNEDPQFVHFPLVFNGKMHGYNETPETFKGNQWVWTYSTPSGMFPYLSLSMDFAVLSFGMLSTKTIEIKYLNITADTHCNITFGSLDTTRAIGKALKELVPESDPSSKYTFSFFCFRAEAPGIRDKLKYKAAVYFLYPISYINYNCCRTIFNFSSNDHRVDCGGEQIEKWPQCILWPFVLAVIFFLYSPIQAWRIVCWIERDNRQSSTEQEMMSIQCEDVEDEFEDETDKTWVYLDGNSPYSFSSLLGHLWCGLDKRNPVLVSRIRRLLLLLLIPTGLYIELLVYYYVFPTEVLVTSNKHRNPIGFLSMLADVGKAGQNFAPAFGGPVYVLATYFIIGFVLLVVPSSLKHVFTIGMPGESKRFKSPLCLSVEKICILSKIHMSTSPCTDSDLFICSMAMIFSEKFWIEVWNIQTHRFSLRRRTSGKVFLSQIVLCPLYVLTCLGEIVLSIVLYGIPFILFASIFIRGISVSLNQGKARLQHYSRNSTFLRKILLGNPLNDFFIIVLITSILLLFSYAFSMIFIMTFTFVFSVMVFCFIAVIVFPSVAFANLFIFIMAIFHMLRLIRKFGDGYTELLSEAVCISQTLESNKNHIECFNKVLAVYPNIVHGVESIRINDRTLPVAKNVLRALFSEARDRAPRVKCYKEKYGIPADLFDVLVLKHRPVHQQVLNVILRSIMIGTLLSATLALTMKFKTGKASDISEMMYVLFVGTVGAFSGYVEAMFMDTGEQVQRLLDSRRLKRHIINYWIRKSNF